MINDISSQAISFLSSFKTFFFFVLAFVTFGSGFLFLFQLFPSKFFLVDFFAFDLGGVDNTFRFLVFAFLVGLLLYAFSLICFRSWYNYLQPLFLKIIRKHKNDTRSEINDVEIIVYLEHHSGVSDVYTLQLFYSLISYLLFSLFAFITFFFACGFYFWISIVITLLLFKLGLSANASVNAFGNQIKDVINKFK
ncbi:MAG: hypothetical protein AAB796_02225 [Patescibacteria group bacterium]